MDHEMRIQYINKINNLKGVSHLINTIAFGVAPTLQCVKPSTILTLTSRSGILENWIKHHRWICDFFSLEYMLLKKNKNSYTLFFYKYPILKSHLQRNENREFLQFYGYDNLDLSYQLQKLQMSYNENFPHEIGIFLGIPPMDVKKFIENNGKKYLLNGYWKVYCNLFSAIDTFEKFDDARIEVMNKISYYNMLH